MNKSRASPISLYVRYIIVSSKLKMKTVRQITSIGIALFGIVEFFLYYKIQI